MFIIFILTLDPRIAAKNKIYDMMHNADMIDPFGIPSPVVS